MDEERERSVPTVHKGEQTGLGEKEHPSSTQDAEDFARQLQHCTAEKERLLADLSKKTKEHRILTKKYNKILEIMASKQAARQQVVKTEPCSRAEGDVKRGVKHTSAPTMPSVSSLVDTKSDQERKLYQLNYYRRFGKMLLQEQPGWNSLNERGLGLEDVRRNKEQLLSEDHGGNTGQVPGWLFGWKRKDAPFRPDQHPASHRVQQNHRKIQEI
ncbi:uncharacterized protein LOC134477553 [Cavia porcellus]|uniref:uncharacterized protein LOC134477553 n=1 Tax=Cavia porcellus TaxID=10141 RepID=UPI002FE0C74B